MSEKLLPDAVLYLDRVADHIKTWWPIPATHADQWHHSGHPAEIILQAQERIIVADLERRREAQ